MQNVSLWQLLPREVRRWIFPGTIGISLRTFLATGNPFCSRMQARLRRPTMSVAIRKIDGTPPIQLGEGSAGGLSPDGKWAIGIIAGSPGRITLYPVGAGQPRTIPVTGLERIHNGSSHFLADGKRITVNGNEPGHGVRCYIVDLDGREAHSGHSGGSHWWSGFARWQINSRQQRSCSCRVSDRWWCSAPYSRPRSRLYSGPMVGGQFRRLWIPVGEIPTRFIKSIWQPAKKL